MPPLETAPAIPHTEVAKWLKNWQHEVCAKIESIDGQNRFKEDTWQYDTGGGGRSRVMAGGAIFEQAGVNFSHILGQSLPPAATKTRPELSGSSFEATGVSLVFHPQSPMMPTTHLNMRLFCTQPKQADQPRTWWFGGGFDLTPYYPFEEDCITWHEAAKLACNQLTPTAYNTYKKACDEYFYLPHRDECRGIGGIFFDDLNTPDFEQCFAFMHSVGDAFISAYSTICERRMGMAYTQEQKNFQLYRRGRYVEFNLLYDRGTLFGLQSGGRTESILMSLPPEVNFKYNWSPIPGSAEAELTERFLKPTDWLSLADTKTEAR